jgi:glutaredoxin 3
MPSVTVYSSPFCPYCFMAKKLLKKKGVSFEEIDVMADPKRKPEMIERAQGRKTVPQIFIGDTHVGGYDDMAALDRDGKLDPLLKETA